MRAIILHDQSFAQVAMTKWGSRDRQAEASDRQPSGAAIEGTHRRGAR